MKLLKIFALLFAAIGVWATIDFILDYSSEQSESKQYVANCSRVEIGMTLKDVREVMGDSTWNSMKVSPQLYYSYYGDEDAYHLYYPAITGASGMPIIKFDAQTMLVNYVNCDIN